MSADPITRRPGVRFIEWERAITRTAHASCACPPVDDTGTPHRPFQPAYLAAVLVLGTYADHETGRNARPGHDRVALVIGTSKQTVGRAVEWAVAHGWLDVVGPLTTSPGLARTYRLTVPPTGARVTVA